MFSRCRNIFGTARACGLGKNFDGHVSQYIQYTMLRQLSTGSDIGFIGLGNMGSHMAVNLAKNGHTVHVYDTSKERMEQVRKMGRSFSFYRLLMFDFLFSAQSDCTGRILTRKSITEMMKPNAPSVIITMLPSSPQVIEVYGSKVGSSTGLIKTAPTKTLFIDCTTGDPKVAQQTAEYAEFNGSTYVDAPVSGGVSAAQQATLTFMVGGTKEAVSHATPLLQAMGKRVFHCGPVGTGLAAKICNNMLLAISMIGTSEAMELGRRLGLDPHILAEIINNSSGRCWSSEVYNPVPGVLPNVPSSKDYEGGFGTALMTKDLGLAQNASTATCSPTLLGSLAHQLYRALCQHGYAQKDFSSVYKFLTKPV